jgi:hypothetical protein
MNTQNKTQDIATIKLTNVRLSYPSLFVPNQYGDEEEPAYKASFILDKVKDAGQIKFIQETMKKLVAEAKVKSVAAYKLCLRDGAEKGDKEGFGDRVMFISSKNRKAIPVVDRDKSLLTIDSGKPYAGCYVNAVVRLWVQDNNFGKRINASLQAVQFSKDGEPFGEGGIDANAVFDDVTDGTADGIL